MAQHLISPYEKGTLAVPVSFKDETGAAVTPIAATWTLTDERGVVVNSRSAVVITSLASSKTIVLSGADLAFTAAYPSRRRHITIEYAYNSSLGSNLPGKKDVVFDIEPLQAVT